jgi:hypothetical protein
LDKAIILIGIVIYTAMRISSFYEEKEQNHRCNEVCEPYKVLRCEKEKEYVIETMQVWCMSIDGRVANRKR